MDVMSVDVVSRIMWYSRVMSVNVSVVSKNVNKCTIIPKCTFSVGLILAPLSSNILATTSWLLEDINADVQLVVCRST